MHTQHNILVIAVLILISTSGFAQITINEVVYKNKQGLQDMDGDTPDWIELYNAGNTSCSLAGFRLSDEKNLDEAWEFPNITIGAHNYLIVFASGKDSLSNIGELHANFKLSQVADPLYLFDSDNHLIDSVIPQCVPVDKSLSQIPDGSGNRVIASTTPAKTNNTARTYEINFQPDTLVVNYQTGIYHDSIEISLQNVHASNEIRYSLNGNEPDDDEDFYTDPFWLHNINNAKLRFANKTDNDYVPGNISKASILRARVFSEGCPASNEIVNTYFIGDDKTFDYHVPIVSIITNEDNLFEDNKGIYVAGNNLNFKQHGKAWERPAHFEMLTPEKEVVLDQDIGIRIHGRGSRYEPQKSLRLYARDKYGADAFNYPIFSQKPYNSYSTLLLSGEKSFSPIIFKDELCTRLIMNMDIDYQAWQAVIVFINGEYWGIQHLRECQKEEYLQRASNKAGPFNIITHDPSGISTEGSDVAYNNLVSMLHSNDLSGADGYELLDNVIDLSNAIDYFVAQFYLANFDFPNNNYRMWNTYTSDNKWRWLLYDCEAAMIFANNKDILKYSDNSNPKYNDPQWSVDIFQHLMANDIFKKQFTEQFYYHLHNTFSAGNVTSILNEFETFYEPLMAEHIYRWNKPGSLRKWQNNVEAVRLFAAQRPVVLYNLLNETFGTPFKIYMQQGSAHLTIDLLEDVEKAQLFLYSTQGKKILTSGIQSSGITEVQADLSPGIYVLEVILNNQRFTEKLLIE